MVVFNSLTLGLAMVLGAAAVTWRELAARSQFAVARALEVSRARVDDLLHTMLLREIASRIAGGETAIADAHGEVSVVLADIVGFTELSRRLSPAELVEFLSDLFSRFDEQAAIHGLQRIKTLGDAYLAVGGLSRDAGPSRGADRDHAHDAAAFALAVKEIVDGLEQRTGRRADVRVGLHIGPVVAGFIGVRRPAFDCWGETVDMAAHLERGARPGWILVSESAFWRLRDTFVTLAVDDIDREGPGSTRAFRLQRATRSASGEIAASAGRP